MQPDLSLIICTYERPENLSRCLASVMGQSIDLSRIEVVIADDGSRDATSAIAHEFAATAPFPVRFVTHPHTGFCPSRCRNEGAAASTSDYLVFLDGDCLIAPNFLATQLRKRRAGVVRIGDCIRLSQSISARIDEQKARSGSYQRLVPWRSRLAALKLAMKDTKHHLLRDPLRPVLTSNNIGIWRQDYERVNGFDEMFIGWGSEDRDFGLRLKRAGLSLQTIMWWTVPVHLWHPPAPSHPKNWLDGPNIAYHNRPARLTQCPRGLRKRSISDLQMLVRLTALQRKQVRIPSWLETNIAAEVRPEIEILFASPTSQFTGDADCNILVVPSIAGIDSTLLARAHYFVVSRPIDGIATERQLAPQDLEFLIKSLANPLLPKLGARAAA